MSKPAALEKRLYTSLGDPSVLTAPDGTVIPVLQNDAADHVNGVLDEEEETLDQLKGYLESADGPEEGTDNMKNPKGFALLTETLNWFFRNRLEEGEENSGMNFAKCKEEMQNFVARLNPESFFNRFLDERHNGQGSMFDLLFYGDILFETLGRKFFARDEGLSVADVADTFLNLFIFTGGAVASADRRDAMYWRGHLTNEDSAFLPYMADFFERFLACPERGMSPLIDFYECQEKVAPTVKMERLDTLENALVMLGIRGRDGDLIKSQFEHYPAVAVLPAGAFLDPRFTEGYVNNFSHPRLRPWLDEIFNFFRIRQTELLKVDLWGDMNPWGKFDALVRHLTTGDSFVDIAFSHLAETIQRVSFSDTDKKVFMDVCHRAKQKRDWNGSISFSEEESKIFSRLGLLKTSYHSDPISGLLISHFSMDSPFLKYLVKNDGMEAVWTKLFELCDPAGAARVKSVLDIVGPMR